MFIDIIWWENENIGDPESENKNFEITINDKVISFVSPKSLATKWTKDTYDNRYREGNDSTLLTDSVSALFGNTLPVINGDGDLLCHTIQLYAEPDCDALNDATPGNLPIQCAEGTVIIDKVTICGNGVSLSLDTGDCLDPTRGIHTRPLAIDSIVRGPHPDWSYTLTMGTDTTGSVTMEVLNENFQRPEYRWNTQNYMGMPYDHSRDATTIVPNITDINGGLYTVNPDEEYDVVFQMIGYYYQDNPFEPNVNSTGDFANWTNLANSITLVTREATLYPEPTVTSRYKENSGDPDPGTEDVGSYLSGKSFNSANDLPAEIIFEFDKLYEVNTAGARLIMPDGTTHEWFIANNSTDGETPIIRLNDLATLPGNYVLQAMIIVPFGNNLPTMNYNGNAKFDTCADATTYSSNISFSIQGDSDTQLNLQ
jgi:hypothetical protein